MAVDQTAHLVNGLSVLDVLEQVQHNQSRCDDVINISTMYNRISRGVMISISLS